MVRKPKEKDVIKIAETQAKIDATLFAKIEHEIVKKVREVYEKVEAIIKRKGELLELSKKKEELEKKIREEINKEIQTQERMIIELVNEIGYANLRSYLSDPKYSDILKNIDEIMKKHNIAKRTEGKLDIAISKLGVVYKGEVYEIIRYFAEKFVTRPDAKTPATLYRALRADDIDFAIVKGSVLRSSGIPVEDENKNYLVIRQEVKWIAK